MHASDEQCVNVSEGWTYMLTLCVLTNLSKQKCHVLWQWCTLVLSLCCGLISQLNTYSSQLLQKILILNSVSHSMLNGGVFIQRDKGCFSLVKCSAAASNSMLIMLTTHKGFKMTRYDPNLSFYAPFCKILYDLTEETFSPAAVMMEKAEWCQSIIC